MSTSPEYREAFAGRVRAARIHAGFSQPFVAKFLGITQSTYSKYEGARGEGETSTLMPPDKQGDFCELCGVNVHWLVTGDGAMQAPRPIKRKSDPAA